MLNADRVPYFETCPRCGIGGLEKLKTHSYCVNCNYYETELDELLKIPRWTLDVLYNVSKEPLRKLGIIPNKLPSTSDLSIESWVELERKHSQYNKSVPHQHLHVLRNRKKIS